MMITKFTRYSLIFAFIALTTNLFCQSIDHWETIIQTGDPCKYYIPTYAISSNWKTKDYDDVNWTSALSGIGFGDDDDNTVISEGVSSVYIRYSFTIESKAQIASLLLDVDYDDGFIAYLNGMEVARANVSDPVSWNMELATQHEASMYEGGNPERFTISLFIEDLLETGENTLAVEVHNKSSNSSDLSSNVFLHAGITDSETIYGDTPEWFWTPIVITDSELPLMIINTNGQVIPDEPRIVADMGLIYNGEGQTNSVFDTWNEYSGKISIERRGESSQGFEKKSYSLEFQNDDGSNNNVSVLGLPKENDFVLHGPYSDKTLMKNVLTYELFRRTGRWAPRTRYIELLINGDYRGIYVLTEKIKRDDNRVDIDKLTDNDILPLDISGGYILRRDKKGGLATDEYWTSPVPQPYHERMWYEYYYPERGKLTDDQANYIKDWMQTFDEMMTSDNFDDPNTGYSEYIRVKSFIDMMFINEITKGIDNYLFSTYFYKENDTDGGQLVAGPPWDFNISYGNVNYGYDWNAPETFGWGYPQGSRVYWFERLMEDETYKNKVYCRWTEFRETIFSDENVEGIIDSCVLVLGDAVDRNFAKYPTLGTYIWPNLLYPDTYEEEIENLRTWLLDRLAWMDSQWYGIGDDCPPIPVNTNHSEIAGVTSVRAFPNPSDLSSLYIKVLFSDTQLKELTAQVFDLQGRILTEQRLNDDTQKGRNIFQISNLSHLAPGVYIYKIYDPSGIVGVGKISKI
ncbi:MAG: T9SS type A sorting domain-containing protein [Bacteroidetes bacterium]|nr:T9SS type A sorting domain-containing protein [Bacteroidota bacterium]